MSYTLPEFLAHALAVEREAAERYLELADMMEAHDNRDVSSLFRDMNHFSRLHHASIRERAGDMELPRLRHGDYRWVTPPETGDEDGFDYTMHAYHALEYARENEVRARDYYRSVAAEATDEEVRRLAGEFAAEEEEHAEALDRMLAQTQRPW